MKKYTEQELLGMTVNERLYVLGLLHQFDDAEKSRDREKMIQILSQCAMTKEQCNSTVNSIMNKS